MDPALSSLEASLPCRRSQIEQLHDLLAHENEPYAEAIYIYGGQSTGKSAVVTSLLETLKIRHVIVNLTECYTAKILFESILNKLAKHEVDPLNPHPYARCDNMMEFLDNLKLLHSNQNLGKFVLVLDKAEELRNMDFNLLAGFLRLRELCDVPVTTIFMSEIIFEKFYSRLNAVEPLKINFPQYNKQELQEILLLDLEHNRNMLAKHYGESIDFELDFYQNYLNVFLSVFYRACRDLSELRHMSRINFVKYCEPIFNKKHTTSDSMGLWKNIAPILKSSLEVLYLRLDCSDDNKRSAFFKENQAQNLELPFYAKYLLIAAYLASYNPAKDDKRLFMKYHGKKTKSRRDVKSKSKVSELLNTQMGPKPFTFDRLLAIFYSILDNKVGFNNNLLVQVSSLVELQLLSAASDNCVLDGQKYKCNVNFDFIQGLSRMVGFNVRKYLSDFSHM